MTEHTFLGEYQNATVEELPEGLLSELTAVEVESRIDITPGYIFTESILKADTIVFHKDASLLLSGNTLPFLVIWAKKWVVQDSSSTINIQISKFPIENGADGSLGKHGLKGTYPDGDGENGEDASDGEDGNDGMSPPPLVLVAGGFSYNDSSSINNLVGNIVSQGSDGSDGGDGGTGGSGGRGGAGKSADCVWLTGDHSWECSEYGTVGGKGGKAGAGGNGGDGGDGGNGGEIYIIGDDASISNFEKWRVLNNGGVAADGGQGGSPGKNGKNGYNGRHRSVSGAGGGFVRKPGVPGKDGLNSSSDGKTGKITVIRTVTIPF